MSATITGGSCEYFAQEDEKVRKIKRNNCRHIVAASVIFLPVFIYSCAYLSIPAEDNTVTPPSFSSGERLVTYNCAVVKGQVISLDETKDPTLLVAYPLSAFQEELTGCIILSSTSPFMFYLSEGDYMFYALTDFNNDGFYTENEVSGFYGAFSLPRKISIRRENVFKGVVIYTSRENSKKIIFPRQIRIDERQVTSQLTYNGQISKIYDENFSLGNASVGWWNPTAFMKAFGAHIYLMEKYDPGKIPVLFVHGAEGSPRNWVCFFLRLDRSRYQMWFFYYPSGIHLSLASGLLYDELMELHVKYGFKKICVVAHSIGGLVARSFLTRYKFDEQSDFVKVYVTFATPWSGFEMADASQNLPHKSLPSWMDIGAQSVFIRRIMDMKLPRNIHYYLFYGKKDQIAEGRALDDRAVSEAKEILGFDCDHNSMLTDRGVFRKFNEILKREFR
ncbi:MAG TPA: alpha/beta hydrolase [Smithellaceae bacterium]|nr:alpha/beta hydrolase [Smithellaceae bacterium]HOF77912.1 alpha/beta hydrolase [Smithellaceae bacterium]HOS09373.1 alpha/beta hydrolase [Smithellaceae bacterium]HOU03961.1 alpha/beta hydrolase [Smithellaceae bacterium]HPD49802.1 alpha/beta hydrolase [Smithellaceae bacterium]